MYARLTRLNSFYEALLIPFEIAAFTLVCSFWSDELTKPGPIAGVVAGIVICYASVHTLRNLWSLATNTNTEASTFLRSKPMAKPNFGSQEARSS
jgi:hypothetical protein